MRLIFVLFLLTGFSVSCRKTDNLSVIDPGKYSGSFQRSGGQVVNVSITFSENNWTGTSDKPLYPALCNGSYIINGGKINFLNSCMWTADFDWTLILDREYIIRVNNGVNLVFARENSGSFSDVYTLKKQ